MSRVLPICNFCSSNSFRGVRLGLTAVGACTTALSATRSHMSTHVTALSTAVSHILQRIDGPLRVGAPLGIGKPPAAERALRATQGHAVAATGDLHGVVAQPARRVPTRSALCRAVHRPPFRRQFPAPCVCRRNAARRLARACASGRVLHAVRRSVAFHPGAGRLHESQLHACRRHGGATHTQLDRTKVAREPGGTRLSLSCNNDITQDTL